MVIIAAMALVFLVVREWPHASTSKQAGSRPVLVRPPAQGPAPRPVVKGCAAVPHSCGYPDGSNTGVSPGVTLKTVPNDVSHGQGWHYDSRGWVEVDGSGAVLDGLYIPYDLDVSAFNVTIKNVSVMNRGDSFGISLRHTRNVTIENSDIHGPDAGANRLMVGIKDIYGDAKGTVVLRDNIWHTATGIQIYAGLVKDNYIHDMGFRPGDHINGATVNGGTDPLTLRHNTVFVSRAQTDAISLFQDFGTEANKIIDYNLLAGGGYSIYSGGGSQQSSNVRITNNRISRIYYANGGYYGPATAFDAGAPGDVWSGNVWDDTGRTIAPP